VARSLGDLKRTLWGKEVRYEKWLVLGLSALVFSFGTGGYWSATWLSKWAVLEAASLGMISFWVARRTSLAYLPLFLYASLSLLVLGLWPTSPYQQKLDAVTLIASQKNACVAIVQFLTCLGLFSWLSQRKSLSTASAISLTTMWAIGTVAILILPSTGNSSPPNNGVFGNPSMSAGLLACLCPIVIGMSYAYIGSACAWKKKCVAFTLWLITLLVIWRTHTSVPWGVLGVVSAALLVSRLWSPTRLKSLFLIGLSVLSLATMMIWVGHSLLGSDFWDQNGRFEIWSMAWAWFKTHGSLSVGLGYSTTQIFLPLEQIATGHLREQAFLWLHNDWLQLAIEGGFVGMTCVYLTVGRLLYITWSKPTLFAALCGFMTLAVFNYPLRMPIHCYCLVLIAAMAEANTNRSVGMFCRKSVASVRKSRLEPA
jgi:hypothetical protein